MDTNMKRLIRIIIGAAIFAIAVAVEINNEAIEFGLFLVSFLIVGGDIIADRKSVV